MRNSLLLLFAALILISCSHNIREDFDDAFTRYNDTLVRSDMRASGLFVADKAREAYLASVNAAKNARIFDYRIVSRAFSEPGRTAKIDVEMDYYLGAAYRVKTLRYIQEWIYAEGKDSKGWKIVTPLPEFK